MEVKRHKLEIAALSIWEHPVDMTLHTDPDSMIQNKNVGSKVVGPTPPILGCPDDSHVGGEEN